MEELFDLTAPWWMYCVRATLIFVSILVLIRLMGKRTLAQFKTFEMIVVVLVGEAFHGALTAGDESLAAALLVAATLLAWNLLLSIATAKSRRVNEIIEGRPVLLARDGVIYHDVLERHHVTEEGVRESMRKAGCPHEDRIGFIFLETDGSLSVVKREDQHRHGPPPGMPTTS